MSGPKDFILAAALPLIALKEGRVVEYQRQCDTGCRDWVIFGLTKSIPALKRLWGGK